MWVYKNHPVQSLQFLGTSGLVYHPIDVDGLHEFLVNVGIHPNDVDSFFYCVTITRAKDTSKELQNWLKEILTKALQTSAIDVKESVRKFITTHNPGQAGIPFQFQPVTKPSSVGPSPIPPQQHMYNFFQPAAPPLTPPPSPSKGIPVTLMTRCGCTKEIFIESLIPEIRVMLMGDVSGFMPDEITGANIADFEVQTRIFQYNNKRSIRTVTFEELEDEYGIPLSYGSGSYTLAALQAKGIQARIKPDAREVEIQVPVYVEIELKKKGKKHGK